MPIGLVARFLTLVVYCCCCTDSFWTNLFIVGIYKLQHFVTFYHFIYAIVKIAFLNKTVWKQFVLWINNVSYSIFLIHLLFCFFLETIVTVVSSRVRYCLCLTHIRVALKWQMHSLATGMALVTLAYTKVI